MNLTALYIGRHISTGGGRRDRRPPSVWIAIVTVALTVAVLELTLAVVAGFRTQIIDKVKGFDADITVLPAYDYSSGESATFIRRTPELENIIADDIENPALSIELRYPAVLKTADDFSAIVLRGYGEGHDFSFEKNNLTEGEWPDFNSDEGNNRIVISTATANALGVAAGDKIDAYFFVDGGIKARKPVIAGLYSSNFADNDRLVAYTSLRWLQKVAGIDSLSGSSLNISLGSLPPDTLASIAGHLQDRLILAASEKEIDELHPVDNLSHTGAIYFNWLDLLDTNVIVIFILMAAVAGFTLISTLVILILERVRTIGILRAVGMSNASVRSIFIYLAMKCVTAGLAAGNIIGLGIIFAQHKWHLLPLNPEMYYLSSVPVEIHWWQILALNAGVFALAWLVLLLPAHIVSTISPAKTMRYE